MKKYISIPDPVKNGINRFFEVPSDFLVQALACDDGVAIVIWDKTSGGGYGYFIPADRSLIPVIEYLEAHEDTAVIEDMLADMICGRISLFLADDTKAVFDIRSCHAELSDELNEFLESSKLPGMSEEGKRRNKRHKNHKK